MRKFFEKLIEYLEKESIQTDGNTAKIAELQTRIIVLEGIVKIKK